MRKFIAMIMGITLIMSCVTTVYGSGQMPDGLYGVASVSDKYDRFTNLVHGYSLNIPKGMNVDMSLSEICAVLENTDLRIEIYKQPIGNGISVATYQNYSNKFLQNTNDHVLEHKATEKIGGKTVYIVQYSRQKLSRVPNDKNYYANLDIVSGNYVYSIFAKSSKPFYEIGGYHFLAENFQLLAPTMAPYMRQTKALSYEEKGFNDETASMMSKYFGENSQLTWGIFEPSAPGGFAELDKIEKAVEYEFPFILNYTSFDNNYAHPELKQRLDSAYAKGKIMELTLQTPDKPDGNMIYDILNGEYDAFLADYARVVSEFDHPVLFRLGNEMNGDWCPYSAFHTAKDTVVFKEFYKYIYGFFERAKADNVVWVWNPNHKSFPNFQWNHEAMYYPGDKYADIIGMTAYNTGTYYAAEKWTSFETLYDEIYYEYARLYKQPLMITEFASSSVGGDKNQWIIDMFNTIEKYDRVKVAIWWDGCDWDANGNIARPYFIDEPYNILETFKKYFNKNVNMDDSYA